MLHWFQKELISSAAADWIDECALWTLEQFGADAFWQHTQLVLPDSTHFPEKVSGPGPMAQYVLGRVTEMAGVAHWPWQLVDSRLSQPTAPPLLGIDPQQRFAQGEAPAPGLLAAAQGPAPTTALQIPLVIDQVSKPQDLVASLAHSCAQHMLWQSQKTPPGGMEYFEQASEVLAVFAGFGIMLTNSAYTYRGSCARCYNPRANRQASLSESESVYALALFCHLKQQPLDKVFKYLKPHLKNSFKLASKQIKNRPGLAAQHLRLT